MCGVNTEVRDYLEDVVKTIEGRFAHRGWTTGKKKWEQRLLAGAKKLLRENQEDLPGVVEAIRSVRDELKSGQPTVEQVVSILRDLKADLTGGRAMPSSVPELAELGVAYVGFALRRPALFRLMFGRECDDANDQRVRAAAELHELLAAVMANVFPGADPAALATAGWALAHGLAFLHLDGKLPAAAPDEAAARVRSSFEAVFSARTAPAPRAG